MKKATSLVDEAVSKRLAFAGMLMHHVGVLSDNVIDEFSRNERRSEIPDRLLHAFTFEGEAGNTSENQGASVKAEAVEEKSQPRIEVLSEVPKPCIKRSMDEQVAGMEMMYNQLGWTFTTSGLVIPKRREGFDRLIIMADPSLTNNKAFEVCKASFPSWRYVEDLDLHVPIANDERHPSRGIYAVWFRDDVESDSKWKNHSLDMMNVLDPKVTTSTLMEHEVHELAYHRETGKHLDIKGWTLLSGSRNARGFVPRACWRDDEFWVLYADSSYRLPGLGPREAVVS